jgi:glucose/arabinose dehydrogenase
MMGVGDSTKVLKDTTGILGNTMQAHPEHVTQPTIDTYATAQRQIARAEGTPLPAGVPAQGAIVNAPVPQGMPAPVPISQLPGAVEAAAKAAPKQFQMPSAEEMAAFRKQTGTAFNAKSINDKLSLERMRGGEETFDSKQANAYRAAHKDYRPGMYTKG